MSVGETTLTGVSVLEGNATESPRSPIVPEDQRTATNTPDPQERPLVGNEVHNEPEFVSAVNDRIFVNGKAVMSCSDAKRRGIIIERLKQAEGATGLRVFVAREKGELVLSLEYTKDSRTVRTGIRREPGNNDDLFVWAINLSNACSGTLLINTRDLALTETAAGVFDLTVKSNGKELPLGFSCSRKDAEILLKRLLKAWVFRPSEGVLIQARMLDDYTGFNVIAGGSNLLEYSEFDDLTMPKQLLEGLRVLYSGGSRIDDSAIRMAEKLAQYQVSVNALDNLVLVNGQPVIRCKSKAETAAVAHNLRRAISVLGRSADGSITPPAISITMNDDLRSLSLGLGGTSVRNMGFVLDEGSLPSSLSSAEGLAARMNSWAKNLQAVFGSARIDYDLQEIKNRLEKYFSNKDSFVLPFEASTSYRLTSTYGMRTHPVHGDRRMHWGIDLAAGAGSRVLSPITGVVVKVERSNSEVGGVVTIQRSDGFKVRICHLSDIPQGLEGSSVSAGQPVARVAGSKANGGGRLWTGPHIHFEAYLPDKGITDPLPFIQTAGRATVSI
ncbi:MAG: M23 family metallopeptidase [Candidatus Margulisiibacteriota bacterium]